MVVELEVVVYACFLSGQNFEFVPEFGAIAVVEFGTSSVPLLFFVSVDL